MYHERTRKKGRGKENERDRQKNNWRAQTGGREDHCGLVVVGQTRVEVKKRPLHHALLREVASPVRERTLAHLASKCATVRQDDKSECRCKEQRHYPKLLF